MDTIIVESTIYAVATETVGVLHTVTHCSLDPICVDRTAAFNLFQTQIMASLTDAEIIPKTEFLNSLAVLGYPEDALELLLMADFFMMQTQAYTHFFATLWNNFNCNYDKSLILPQLQNLHAIEMSRLLLKQASDLILPAYTNLAPVYFLNLFTSMQYLNFLELQAAQAAEIAILNQFLASI